MGIWRLLGEAFWEKAVSFRDEEEDGGVNEGK